MKTSLAADRSLPSARLLASRITLLICLLMLQACATSSALTTAREQFRHGGADAALRTLSKADVSQRDQLLLLLDTGLVAQAAAQHEQSIKAFESAYQLIERLDYLSVRDQTAAMVSSDWALRYTGELSERLWIHTFQMINFLMIDNPAGAAVEARRAAKLYEQNSEVLDSDLFTRYLMALSFEAAGQFDSAAVEYRKLARLTKAQNPWKTDHTSKHVVLMVATGFIAPKLPGDLVIDINARISFPYYPEVYERSPNINVIAGSDVLPTVRADTRLLPIAQSALAKRGKAIAARQAMRVAAKYSLADSIESQNELAGNLIRLFLFAIEQADTRSWETLPAHLSLLRVEVPENVSSVKVRIDNDSQLYDSRDVHLQLDDKKAQFHMIRVGIEEHTLHLASP